MPFPSGQPAVAAISKMASPRERMPHTARNQRWQVLFHRPPEDARQPPILKKVQWIDAMIAAGKPDCWSISIQSDRSITNYSLQRIAELVTSDFAALGVAPGKLCIPWAVCHVLYFLTRPCKAVGHGDACLLL